MYQRSSRSAAIGLPVMIACLALLILTMRPQAVVGQTQPITRDMAITLARNAVVALNHANQTGNYSVLRDLGSPAFAAGNSAARLAVAFTEFRNQNLNLDDVLLVEPEFSGNPQVDKFGQLRISGFFPTTSVRVNFDLVFDNVNGRWQLFGLLVNPTEPPAHSDAPAPSASVEPNTPEKTEPAKPSPPTVTVQPALKIDPDRFGR